MEDDATFSADIASAIVLITHLMLSQPELKSADIVFLDYFLNRDLFAHVIGRRQNLDPGRLEFVSASRAYLACCSSFLVRRSSASHISRTLSNLLDSADVLRPVDLTLRHLLHTGDISGFVVVPPLAPPGWEQDDDSTIQANADYALRFSQRSHVLLRLLASGIKSPFWCSQKLQEMYGIASPLEPDSNANDFLLYFDSLMGKMPVF